jgi:hypothetical protein
LENSYLPELAIFFLGEGEEDLARYYVARALSAPMALAMK